MSYITDTLGAGETIIGTGSLSKWSMFHLYFAALLFGLTLIFLPISAFLLIYAFIMIATTEMGVTSKRVIRKTGLIVRDTTEIKLEKVESVSVQQGLLGRMFGYGTVIIAGSGGSNAIMKGVRNPLGFRALVDAAASSVAK